MSFFEESAFANFVANAMAIFLISLWLWLFVVMAADLHRREDMSGLSKAFWVILLVALPYVGILAYILTQGRSMARREEAQALQERDELRGMARFSVADELAKLVRLRSQKAISDEEYLTLRRRLLA